jgi:hypothetical protein
MAFPTIVEVEGTLTSWQAARLRVPARMAQNFDLIVIGSGPAGRRAAVQAAKLKKMALVIRRRSVDLRGTSDTAARAPAARVLLKRLWVTGGERLRDAGRGKVDIHHGFL